MYFETIRLRPFYQFFESINSQTVQHADVSEQVPTMGRLRGDTGADIFWIVSSYRPLVIKLWLQA